MTYQDRWEIVRDEMRNMILTGEMPLGSKISEVELAERFGVSRGPIRESLRSLEYLGLVVREPRKSAHVVSLRASDVEELFALREAIEVLAVKRSLELNRDSVVSALQASLREPEKETASAAERGLQMVEADIRFHGIFYEAAENQRLLSIWGNLTDSLSMMMRLSSFLIEPAWRESRGDHTDIANAAIMGDIDGCAEATLAHLDKVRKNVLRLAELS
jgi:GntR family transcriptional regulator, gluconate operon transcriptional repressor